MTTEDKTFMTTLDRIVIYVGVLLAVLLAALGLYDVKTAPQVSQVKKFLGPGPSSVQVALSYNAAQCTKANCPCQQQSAKMEGDWVVVNQGNYLNFLAPAGTTAIDVQTDPANSPFTDLPNNSGSSVSSGGAAGTVGNYYTYTVTFNHGNPCTSGTPGLVMR